MIHKRHLQLHPIQQYGQYSIIKSYSQNHVVSEGRIARSRNPDELFS